MNPIDAWHVAEILRGGIHLPSSRLEIGHCVILNEFEEPSGRMVCVIVDKDDDFFYVKYINADSSLGIHNWNSGMKAKRDQAGIHRMTPLSVFGVRIIAYHRAATIPTRGRWYYICEKIGESTATYCDGKPRRWQERHSCEYAGRLDVIMTSIASAEPT